MVLLDAEKRKDEKKLSYQLRPLVRHKYITRRSDNLYSLTQKGKNCVPNSEPLVKCGGDVNSRKRAAVISGVAALLAACGISGCDSLPTKGGNVFIPAPKWRDIRIGLLSTVRFAGMLYWETERLVVYDIGDGSMQWQLFAERSLFFASYGSYETRATGMLFLCENDKCIEISQQIIRQTMWHRKTLLPLGNGLYFESDKKRKVAKSPIKLHEQYKKVFLCEKQNLEIQLRECTNKPLC